MSRSGCGEDEPSTINDLWREKYYDKVQELVLVETKLETIKDFANNKYLEGTESTTSYPGGYYACLKDLKQILEEK